MRSPYQPEVWVHLNHEIPSPFWAPSTSMTAPMWLQRRNLHPAKNDGNATACGATAASARRLSHQIEVQFVVFIAILEASKSETAIGKI